MGVFEFLLALYSIVAGLGMSLLVRSIGQMIAARDRLRPYWVHGCFFAVVFVAQVVAWLSLWLFRDHSPWTVIDTLFLLAIPLLLYLAGYMAAPELNDGRVHDMREYYYRHARWTQGLLLAVVVISLGGEAFILGRFEPSPPRMLRIAFGFVLLPGLLTLKPAVHATQAALLLLVVASGVSFVWISIG